MSHSFLTEFLSNPSYPWLAAGVVLMILEAVGLSGAGFFFAGFSAVTTGLAISQGWVPPDDQVRQFVVFFIATAVWLVVLWAPVKRFRIPKPGHEYHNIVGETALVGSNGVSKGEGGEATWSGTIMKAQLAKESPADSLPAGAQVTIVHVTGTTLIVIPKD